MPMKRRISFAIILVCVASLLLSSTALAAPADSYSSGFWYTVRAGDTVFAIGRRYGVSPYTLASVNGLVNWNYIYVGQQLWVPTYTPVPTPGCARTHLVAYGDTMLRIGRLYGVSPWSIASANGIYNLNVIYAGQRLCIP
jgi:LysM repeat protein